MRRRRPTTLVAVLLGAFAVVVAGCAPGPANPVDRPTGAVKVDPSGFRGKSLTYVYFTDGPDEQATRTAIARFEKQTGVTVNLQIVPVDSLDSSLQARLSADNVPEVARVKDSRAYSDVAVDFTRYFGKDYPDQFTPAAARTVLDGDGHMYSVPSDVTINGPFVNVDAFEKAGVPVPKKWTWPQLVSAAKKVATANNMQYALAFDKSGNRLSTVLSQFGTNMLGPGDKNILDKPKAVQALTFFTKLVQDDTISKDFWLGSGSKYTGADDIFLAKQAPVYLSGPWQVGAFAKDASFRWTAVPNPCAERCGGYPGGKYMVAFQSSPDPDMGAYFVEWMNRTENQRQLDEGAFWLPTRRDLTASGIDYSSHDDSMKAFLQQLRETPADTYPGSTSPAFTVSADALINETDKVVAGDSTVNAAVDRLSGDIDAAIAEAGG